MSACCKTDGKEPMGNVRREETEERREIVFQVEVEREIRRRAHSWSAFSTRADCVSGEGSLPVRDAKCRGTVD
jgi:hypothetical protein